jgi:hypothetical protein
MKIAIVCPIGDLNRFGYWRIAQPCLESWRTLGDLFLVHSSRTALPFSIDAEYIRADDTLMRLIDGSEWFDHRLVADNANIGIAAARAAGYDAAITICVNWYVEREAARKIEAKCERMVESGNRFGFLYRRLQLGGQLFDSDLESISLLNIGKVKQDVVKVLVDSIEVDGIPIKSIRGNFPEWNTEAYIDCEFELTTDELMDKLLDVRNYAEILPKRRGVDWAYWEHYFRQRALRLNLSSDKPGEAGQRIAALHPDGAFSDWLLHEAMAA